MSISSRRRAVVLALLGATGAACSSKTGSDAGTLPGAPTIGPNGGLVRLDDGAAVEIPAGALDHDIEVSITRSQQQAVVGYEVLSNLYVFEPAGTVFLRPVRVTLPVLGTGDPGAVIYWSKSSGAGYEGIGGVSSGAVVAAEVSHFSQGFVAAPVRVCKTVGFFDQGAAGASEIDVLCNSRSDSWHVEAARFPNDIDLGALAQSIDKGIVDLNLGENTRPFGVAYAWVDDVFIGRLPRENPQISCQLCGIPCPDWTTLVLDPGVHRVRAETFDHEACTLHFNQSNVICGDDFDPRASLTGLYQGTFLVTAGGCSSVSLTPVPQNGGSDGGVPPDSGSFPDGAAPDGGVGIDAGRPSPDAGPVADASVVDGGAGGTVNPYAAGRELHVNTFESEDQKGPQVASAADGRFVVVWSSQGQVAPSLAEIWGQLFDRNGAKVGAEFQISATGASNTYYTTANYDVAMAADGRFVVAWSGYGQTVDGNLYAQRFGPTGATVGARIVVDNTSDEWSDYKVSVAMANDGSFGVLYDWGLNFTVGLKVSTYDASGARVADGAWVTRLRRASEIDLAVPRGTNGPYVAVYRYFDVNTEIWGQRFDSAGGLVGGEFHVNTTLQGAQRYPAVDIRDDGSFVAVWQSDHSGQGPSTGVFAQRFDSAGAPVGGEMALSAATSGNLSSPRVVAGADGTFLTVWSGDGGPVASDWSEVWGRRFSAAGVPVGDPFRVNTFSTFKQEAPVLAGTADGPAVAAWTDFKQEIVAAGNDASRKLGVYAQRLQP